MGAVDLKTAVFNVIKGAVAPLDMLSFKTPECPRAYSYVGPLVCCCVCIRSVAAHIMVLSVAYTDILGGLRMICYCGSAVSMVVCFTTVGSFLRRLPVAVRVRGQRSFLHFCLISLTRARHSQAPRCAVGAHFRHRL